MIRRFVYVKTPHIAMHPRTRVETEELPTGLIVKHGFEAFAYCEEPEYGTFDRDVLLTPDIDEQDWYYDEASQEIQEQPLE